MATVNVSITLKQQAVPVNPPASSTIRYQLKSGDTVVGQSDVGLPATGATFSNVVDGTYTVTAQRLNNLNTPIGDSATAEPFTVVNTVDVDVPDIVSIAL
jgi:hypothetical protein